LLKEQGSFNLVQNRGHKGPVLRSRCTGPGRAQTQILFYSTTSLHGVTSKQQQCRTSCPLKMKAISSFEALLPYYPVRGASHLTSTNSAYYKLYQIFRRGTSGRSYYKHLGVDRGIILKWIAQE